MYKYIFSFSLYLLLIVSYLVKQYHSRTLVHEKNLEDSVCRNLSSSINSFELLNDSYYKQYEDKMAFIIKDANGASVKTRDKVRYKLRKEFTTLYNTRKLADLSTFHIFDKYGYSILRFHKLGKYDDAIVEKRASLKRLSTVMKAQEGFAIGQYAVTYRFQYPLFYDGKFVGSYEFGIEFNALDKEMQKLFGTKNVLFVDAKKIDKLDIDKVIKNKYTKINLNGKKFYILKTKMNKDMSVKFNKIIKLYSIKNIATYDKVSFAKFLYNGSDYLAIVKPIKDINGKYIGFMLTNLKDNVSAGIFKTTIEEFIFAVLLGIVIMFLVYEELEYRKYIRNIIDTQHDMLIVTDGKNIKDVNQSFLDFFEIESIKDFLKHHNDCVCDYFEKENGYLQKDVDGISWTKYIKQYPKQEHIAILRNTKNQKKYFHVKIEGFSKSNEFIVILSDITKELKLKKELEIKAYYDTLTNIYTRDIFDTTLKKKLKQKREFSLIMFDIDHFKIINDKYGHDVGDSVLVELTKLVSKHIREDDLFARWGGEEFMVIVNIDITKAKQFAEKLRQVIDEYNFKYVKNVTCSFGVVAYKESDKNNTIIKRVDEMLYHAKDQGRNCVSS